MLELTSPLDYEVHTHTCTHTQLFIFFPPSSTCTQSLRLRHKDSLFLDVQLVFTSTPRPLLSTSTSLHPRPPTPTRLQTAHHSINGSHSSTYTCMCMCEFVCPESASVDSLHYRCKHVIGCVYYRRSLATNLLKNKNRSQTHKHMQRARCQICAKCNKVLLLRSCASNLQLISFQGASKCPILWC